MKNMYDFSDSLTIIDSAVFPLLMQGIKMFCRQKPKSLKRVGDL